MHKFINWRKLQLAIVLMQLYFIAGCGGYDDQVGTDNEYDIPVSVSMDALAEDYDNYVGQRVYLEGILSKGEMSTYEINPKNSDENMQKSSGISLSLQFDVDNQHVNFDQCVGEIVVATGFILQKNVLRVQYIDRQSDSLALVAEECYRPWD